MAVTDPAKGAHGGISCFMVDMKTPGLTLVTRYKTMMGEEPWHITFDDMKSPGGKYRRQRRRRVQAGAEMARHRPA